MKVSTRRDGEIGILAMVGDLDLGADTAAFHAAVRELVSGGAKHILVDLAGVGYVSSPGLGALVSGMATLRETGGQFKLVAPAERVRAVLAVTRLTQVFEIFGDQASALASFGA